MKKKSVLAVTGILAAAVFAPEASAIPAFARQTGMACMACHQQHFPVLNSFGQSFKSSGYTLMGAQGKVEGEHLSLPDTLNAAVLMKARYVKTNGTDAAGAVGGGNGTSTNNGQWQFGDEFSLFFGGRVAENTGFMLEGNLNGSQGAGLTAVPGLVAGIKMPFMYDVDAFKVGVIPFSTDALGAAYGFELSSTGAVRNVRWAEHRTDTAAQQYINTGSGGGMGYAGQASGLAFIAKHDLGYLNVSRWTPNHMIGGNGQANASTGFSSTYVRLAATPSVGDWMMHAGVQLWGGQSELLNGLAAGSANIDTKARAVDFQAHGAVSEMPIGIYATWANAPASGAACGAAILLAVAPALPAMPAGCNLFNTGTADRKAWTIGADLSVIPNKAHVGMAIRRANTGIVNAAGTNESDNSVTLMGIYDLAQNIALHVNHSKRSGDAYNAGGSAGPVVATGAWSGDSLTTFLLEMAW